MDIVECGVSDAPVKRKTKKQPEKGRSKLSNSLFHLRGLNGNSKEGRRYRDSIKATLADMGKGEGDLTDSEKELLRNVGMMTLRLDALHARLQSGEGAVVEGDLALNRLVGTLNRTRRLLGAKVSHREPPKLTLAEALEGKRKR
jgi:hypothetical protein